jgi:hypothetical protein
MVTSAVHRLPTPRFCAPASVPEAPVRFALALMLVLIAAAHAPARAYDSSWHKATGWSGEYPNGFTIARDLTIDIRAMPDPDAPKSVACRLKKGATYHQWNSKRVAADHLEFISFTKIRTYRITDKLTVRLERQADGRQAAVTFRKGDTWSFLAALAEGSFLMKFNGEVYVAGQDMFARSTEVAKPGGDGESDYDEWLGLRCANGAVGWILAGEVKGKPGFGGPNITGYGAARDGRPSR